MKRPKILYITRKNPPEVGGMEAHSAALLEALTLPIFLIRLTRKQHHLVWWLPWAFLRGLVLAKKVDIIFLQDAVLAPLGALLKILTKKPVVVVAHGLDVIYPNTLFQMFVPRSILTLDHVICVSEATRIECVKRGVPESRTSVVPNGIQPHSLKSTGEGHVLVLGRLVERKGALWLVQHVAPFLPHVPFDIVGTGPLLEEIRNQARGMENVRVHGRVSDAELVTLWRQAGGMVMGNCRVEGDMEGFGITAIEAGSWGVPVVASRIEGIPDAVRENAGILVPPMDVQAFLQAIQTCLTWTAEERAQIKAQTQQVFDWKKIAQQYEHIFYTVAGNR